MNSTPLQQAPYLREQRQFPNDDLKALSNQMDHAYIDIAQKVNNRTIGTYAVNFSIITGDKWFLTGSAKPQQVLRQAYLFNAAGNIPHKINNLDITEISPNSYGSYTDGTNGYGVIFGSSVPIPGQVSFYVTAVDIVVLLGIGAPAITSGIINLEWISVF